VKSGQKNKPMLPVAHGTIFVQIATKLSFPELFGKLRERQEKLILLSFRRRHARPVYCSQSIWQSNPLRLNMRAMFMKAGPIAAKSKVLNDVVQIAVESRRAEYGFAVVKRVAR